MNLARPLAIACAVFLAILAVLPVAGQTTQASKTLYLLGDGSLQTATQGAATSCVALSAQGPATATKQFTGAFTNQTYTLQGSIVLTLSYANGAAPGTGLQVKADLKVGGASPLAVTKNYPTGTSISSPDTFVFESPHGNLTGPLTLTLTLTKTGTGPLAAGQSLAVQCSDQNTAIHPFNFAGPGTGGSGEPGTPTTTHTLSQTDVLLVALGAGIVTLIAGLLVMAGRNVSEKRLHLLLGGTAGLLVAVAIVDLVPEALEGSGGSAAWTIALSLLALTAIGWIVGHGHSHGHDEKPGHSHDDGHAHLDVDHSHDDHDHEEEMGGHNLRLAAVAFTALLFHRIVDGVTLPGAFAAGNFVGFAASSAVLIHQFPDGIAAASVLLAARLRRKQVFYGVIILSFATPIGAVLGLGVAGIEGILPHLIAVAAATFLFIGLVELLPELRRPQFRWFVATGFVIGYIVTYGIQLLAQVVGITV